MAELHRKPGLSHLFELLILLVLQGSELAGKTVAEAGLRGMPGLFLVYVDQADGTQLHAVAPQYRLQVGVGSGNPAGVIFACLCPAT